MTENTDKNPSSEDEKPKAKKKPKTTPAELASSDLWQLRIAQYREEPIISAVLKTVPKFEVDTSLMKELRTFFPHLEEGDLSVRQIRGPADFEAGLSASGRMLAIKDRVASITMAYEDYKIRAERLHTVIRSHISTKKEFLSLKNEAQRSAIVSLAARELEALQTKIHRILSACHLVTKNLNTSYNMLKMQVDIVKEMRYEAGLTRAVSGSPLSKEL